MQIIKTLFRLKYNEYYHTPIVNHMPLVNGTKINERYNNKEHDQFIIHSIYK